MQRVTAVVARAHQQYDLRAVDAPENEGASAGEPGGRAAHQDPVRQPCGEPLLGISHLSDGVSRPHDGALDGDGRRGADSRATPPLSRDAALAHPGDATLL